MPQSPEQRTGELIRKHRIDVLGKSQRDMAEALGITPPHLTDLEKGRRTPSEELLVKIAKLYDFDIAVLRAGWSRADAESVQALTSSVTSAKHAPALMRAVRKLPEDKWAELIEAAERMAKEQRGRKRS